MKKFRIFSVIIVLFVALIMPSAVNAQQMIVDGITIQLPDLNNPRHQELLKQRAKECVRQMNTYITSMTKKAERDANNELHPTLQDRNDFRTAALELFLDNGDSITLSNGVKGAPALMETSNGRTGFVNSRPVKDYFLRLINMIIRNTYTEVKITSTDIENMDATNLVKVGDRYQCVVTYYQDFVGRRGEIKAYADRTKKQIVVWFVPYHSPYGDEVVPRLGDISAKETVLK